MVVNSYTDKKHGEKSTVKKIYNVSNGSLYNWVNKKRFIKEDKDKKPLKYTPEIKCFIRNYVIRRINFDMRKLIKSIKSRYKIDAKKSSIYNIIKKFKITRKRIRSKFIYGNKNKLRKKKQEFKKIIRGMDKDNIISIDETDINTHMKSIYGWSYKGNKIFIENNRLIRRYSLICAISNKRIITYEVKKGSINGVDFLNFIKNLINENEYKNKILLMDNARIHHTQDVKNIIRNSNNRILYNVPYCPEYNPIEKVFSKFKEEIRKRTNEIKEERLQIKIKKSLNKITKNNLINFYKSSLNF